MALVDCNRPLMFSRVHRPATLAKKKQVVISYYSINPLGAHAMSSISNALITQNAPDTSISVGAKILNKSADISKQHLVIRPGWRPPSVRPCGLSSCKTRDMAARYTKNRANNSYYSSLGSKGDCAIHFLALPYSTVSLRIPFSRVLLSNASSSCLMRMSASAISEAGTRGSLAPAATWEISWHAFIHWKSCAATTPAWGITIETVIPGSKGCFTSSSFWFRVQRQRRCFAVITSMRLVLFPEFRSVNVGLLLLRSLRNTCGTVNQWATSEM